MPERNFKLWLQEMYYRNKDERSCYRQPSIDLKEYFNQNKWYLKKLYKETENGNR
jgi:predicted deacetylase